jgi:hypothetical protein
MEAQRKFLIDDALRADATIGAHLDQEGVVCAHRWRGLCARGCDQSSSGEELFLPLQEPFDFG